MPRVNARSRALRETTATCRESRNRALQVADTRRDVQQAGYMALGLLAALALASACVFVVLLSAR